MRWVFILYLLMHSKICSSSQLDFIAYTIIIGLPFFQVFQVFAIRKSHRSYMLIAFISFSGFGNVGSWLLSNSSISELCDWLGTEFFPTDSLGLLFLHLDILLHLYLLYDMRLIKIELALINRIRFILNCLISEVIIFVSCGLIFIFLYCSFEVILSIYYF